MCRRGLLAVALLLTLAVAAFGKTGTTPLRSYNFREPHDRGVVFAIAVTPEQDVLSLVAKHDGKYRFTRVRGWLDEKPQEQTIDVPGIAAPLHPEESAPRLSVLSVKLIVTSDGRFAISIASGIWHKNGETGTYDDVVSVIDLHAFRVVNTDAHSGPIRVYALDRAGLLAVRTATSIRDPAAYCDNRITKQPVRTSTTELEWNGQEIDLQFVTIPDLAATGACHYRETLTCGGKTRDDPGAACAGLLTRTQGSSITLDDFLKRFFENQPPARDPLTHRCPTTGVTRDGRFEKESCFGFPTRTFWGNTGKPTEYRENILSLTTGKQVGGVDEFVKDSVQSHLADHDGKDYLLVIEGGTRLKIYSITE